MSFSRGVLAALTLVLSAVLATASAAQTTTSIPSYYDQNRFNLTSPSTQATPAGGFTNPAAYGWLGDFSGQFGWSNTLDRLDVAEQWGLFTGFSRVGFGMFEKRAVVADNTMADPEISGDGTAKVQDMRVALVDHHWDTTIGVAYGWSTGDDELMAREDVVQVGMMHMVGHWLRFGAVGTFSVKSSYQVGYFDAAVRPFGRWLTVFGDMELPKGVHAHSAPWSAGALFQGIRGIQVAGRYFSDESVALSVSFRFYGLWLTGSPSYDQDRSRTGTTYEVRF